jgi:ferrous iron transport protein B
MGARGRDVTTPRIALAGNPNTGKTTLFNRLTGANARVGNYPGVTVELETGPLVLPGNVRAEIVDVPGSYSLVARSQEEQVAVECLLGTGGFARPAVTVFCADATNLARNLYIVLQAMELGLNLVIALTMIDETGENTPSTEELSSLLGVPVIGIVARTGQGLDALKLAIADALDRSTQSTWRWRPSPELTTQLESVRRAFPQAWPDNDALALWAIMSLTSDHELALDPGLCAAVRAAVPDDEAGKRVDDEAILARYAFIDAHVLPLANKPSVRTNTERVDAVLMHPVGGFALFLLISFALFQSLFAWSEPAISAIEAGFGFLGEHVASLLGSSWFSELMVEGVIGGAGAVVVFLPQILLLFFFIGLMEDSGYMARVAFLMDRIMKALGLHGRAFVPMLSGFACAVPAIMATRTMERQRDRLLTMMVVPLMTCSARLPVYTLIIGALFPAGASFYGLPVQGGLMVALYLFSIAIALLAAWVLSKTVLPSRGSTLILELPPYRLPRLPDVLRMMWKRARAFLTEAGTVILAASVVLWFLLNFPKPDDVAGHVPQTRTDVLQHSYGGQLGKAIEPVLAPLGFDWKIGIGIIGAFAAREVFVATMGVVYNAAGDVEEDDTSLRDKLRAEKKPDGSPAYTPLMGLSLLVFFALACQCMSTLAVVKRETHGYRWPAFLFAYMTALAWVTSFIIYQGGRALGFG